jgi:hypothetical protein
MNSKKSLFVFIDESGNFDFSPTGTRHLVLSAVIFQKPIRSASRLLELKYRRYANGFNSPGFHASEDRNNTRHQVFEVIASDKHLKSFTAVLDKADYRDTSIRPTDVYYSFGLSLAKHLRTLARGKKVILVFDKALMARDEKALFASLKTELSSYDSSYLIYFQNVSKDLNAQIADYVAWAHFVFFERSKSLWIDLLPERLSGFGRLAIEP